MSWLNLPFVSTLGMTLLHSLWEGAAVALALALLLTGLRSPRARYAAASLALVALIAIPCLTFVRLMTGPEMLRFYIRGIPSAAITGTNEMIQPGMADRSKAAWLVPLWFAGVLIFCLRSAIRWNAARRIRIAGVCSAPDQWQATMSRLCTRMKISRPVQLLESCFAEVPAVAGVLRPVILLPLGLLTGLPAAQIEAILLHELAHIRRSDYLINLLQVIAENLFFYHPAIWWISGIMRREREHCCDDLVVSMTGNAWEYASALTAVEQARSAQREVMAATGGNLMLRIRRILKQERVPAPARPGTLAAILITLTATALAAWQLAPAAKKPEPVLMTQATPGVFTPDNRWSRWLDEDVVYIITSEERDAFLRLGAEAEREHFVEQFWARRDPTPATEENEFKEEHYRRIAYADDHFTASTPGWRTDRGRIYIQYGPPDELDNRSDNGVPIQQWHYRWIDGMGQNVIIDFADQNNTGDYRMTMDPRTTR